MEYLSQRYIKYFYIVLICAVILQLVNSIFNILINNYTCCSFILIIISIVNIILLYNGLKCNTQQNFIECKANLKILRITLAIFTLMQIIFKIRTSSQTFDLVTIGNYLSAILVIEIILYYRIQCIEFLEKLANRKRKTDDLLSRKEG